MKKKKTFIYFDFGFPDDVFIYLNKPFRIKGEVVNKILTVIGVSHIYKISNTKGYVEIPSTVLKKVHSNYRPYIKYLINKNIIECDNLFVYKSNDRVSHIEIYELFNRSKSMGYRFSWEFSQSIHVKKVIYRKEVVDVKVPRKSIKKKTSKSSINPESINYEQIEISPDTLIRLKRDFRSATITTINPDKIYYDDSSYLNIGKWLNNVLKLHVWSNVSTTFKVRSNRIYTNFTTLSSTVRRECITLSGHKIKELDIKNSFPLMLGLYSLQQNPQLSTDPDFINYCTWVKSGKFYDNLVDILNRYLNSDTKVRDEKYRKSLLKSRKHFEKTGEKLKVIDFRYTPKRILTRKVVKELFQIYLNGNIKRSPLVKGYGDSFLRQQMSNYFCGIDEIVSYDKSNNKVIYYNLSLIESKFIMGIIEELYNRLPDIRILTCHDSIYYPDHYEYIVHKIWEDHLSVLYNLLPGEVVNDLDEYDESEILSDVDLNIEECQDTDENFWDEDDWDDDDWPDDDEFQ